MLRENRRRIPLMIRGKKSDTRILLLNVTNNPFTPKISTMVQNIKIRIYIKINTYINNVYIPLQKSLYFIPMIRGEKSDTRIIFALFFQLQ
jgi:hypothetical protein